MSSRLLGTTGIFTTVHFSLQIFVEIYFYKNNFVQSWQTAELLSTLLDAFLKDFEFGSNIRITN